MLQLISKNFQLPFQDDLFKGSDTKSNALKEQPQEPFLFDFQKASPNLYVFRVQDFIHELVAEMTLERKSSFAYPNEGSEENHLVSVIACDFPPINTQKLNHKIFGDECLQAMVLIQFQLKVLEQLLLFCETKDATCLILNFDQANPDYLKVYHRFSISEKQVITARGEQTEIVIPTDVETSEKVVEFMGEVDKSFGQMLWREQKTKPAFQRYLKKYSLSEF